MGQSLALAAPEQIKSGALSAPGASLTSTQLTRPRAAVTSPAIRGAVTHRHRHWRSLRARTRRYAPMQASLMPAICKHIWIVMALRRTGNGNCRSGRPICESVASEIDGQDFDYAMWVAARSLGR